MTPQANMTTVLTTYTVFQDFGTFGLYDPMTESLVKELVAPVEIDGLDAERAWFSGWCRENGVDPIFDN